MIAKRSDSLYVRAWLKIKTKAGKEQMRIRFETCCQPSVSAIASCTAARRPDRIYADNYILVNEFGVVVTKAPRLAAIESGELQSR